MTLRRRSLAAGLGSAATLPWPALAQERAVLHRIGVLSAGAPVGAADPDPSRAFRQGLREAGLIEGENLVIEWRHARGDPRLLDTAANDLVRLRVEVLLAGGPAALNAARRATQDIPIVGISGSDPVREGWARRLAQPGGNTTGFTVTFPELASKWLELLRVALPGIARVAVVLTPKEVPNPAGELDRLRVAAASLDMTLRVVEVSEAGDVGAALQSVHGGRAQAALLLATNTILSNRSQLADKAIGHSLPTISDFPLMAQAGIMMAYGADLDDLSRRAAGVVYKILKGARPGDLPIERPQKLSLVLNQRTVRALGLTMPKAFLLRVDEVIE